MIHEGKMIQMPCTPPESDPQAEISWFKDGQEISRDLDSNYILANDGSLIISTARLNDSGNYTCEAKNIANKRISENAQIVVFVENVKKFKGDQESVEKLLPTQRRTRLCNNPAPLNGGKDCIGEDEQFNGCRLSCEVFGNWNEWSSWSGCDSLCQKSRSRKCQGLVNPESGQESVCLGPEEQFSFCASEDISPLNCTALKKTTNANGHQFNNHPSDKLNFGGPNELLFDKNNNGISESTDHFSLGAQFVTLSVLGIVSTAILILLLFVCGFLCYKKVAKNKKKKNFRCPHYEKDTVRTVLLSQHQKTHATLAAKISSFGFERSENHLASPYPYNFTLNSKMSANSNYSFKNNPNKSVCSRALDTNAPKYIYGKTMSIKHDGYSSDDNYASLYDIETDTIQHSLTPASNTTYQEDVRDRFATIIAANIDTIGGKIKLQKNGASLFVSEGTLATSKMLFLALSDDIKDKPILSDDEHCLSSLVMCGVCENNSTTTSKYQDDILKPIVLSFDHNASLFPKDNWVFTIYANFGLQEGWHPVNSFSSSESIAKLATSNVEGCIFSVEREKCHVMSNKFGQFLLTGKSKKKNNKPSKRIHISAYISANELNSTCPLTLRVYFVPETGMAVENIRQQEENQGYLIAELNNFLLNEKGSIGCQVEENISPTAFKELEIVEISEASHNWCSQNGLHISVTLPNQPFFQSNNQQRSLSPSSLCLELWEAQSDGSERAVLDLLQTLRVLGSTEGVDILEKYVASLFDYN
uniref:Netrin receptor UNC5 n=1 Tax=Rhabditophanes sp. KR3021 TaxID=114890 RepID=A0AC35U5L4_9BILA